MDIGCYIIFSEKLNRFYIGSTQDGIEKRILNHNNHAYGNHRYTAKANDWELFLMIVCVDFNQARRVEIYIKRMKSKRYIENLKKFPEMVLKLQGL